MQNNEIISAIAQVLTDKVTYEFTVPIREPFQPKRTLLEWIKRKPLQEPILSRHFKVYRPVINNMYRIAGVAAKLPIEVLRGTLSEIVLPLIFTHRDDIVYIIATGIQNTKREPDFELIDFIGDNFDDEDMFNCLQAVLGGEWMQNFFNSIALVKGTVKILEPSASPLDGSEQIASHIVA